MACNIRVTFSFVGGRGLPVIFSNGGRPIRVPMFTVTEDRVVPGDIGI